MRLWCPALLHIKHIKPIFEGNGNEKRKGGADRKGKGKGEREKGMKQGRGKVTGRRGRGRKGGKGKINGRGGREIHSPTQPMNRESVFS